MDEVYHTSFTSPTDAAAAWGQTFGLLGLAATSVLGSRLACLSNQCVMYYSRFAGVDADKGNGTVLQRGNAAGFRGSENSASDAAGMEIKGFLAGSKRNVRLGGLPDNVVSGNTIQLSFIQSYIIGFNGFLRLASGQGQAVIRVRESKLGGLQSYNIIGSTKPTQDSLIVLKMANQPGGGFAPNSFVDLSVRGQPQIRGRWKVAVSDPVAMTVTLYGSQRVSAPAVFAGLLTPFVPVTTPWFTGTTGTLLDPGIVQLTPHKLGKKKYQPRARRSPVLIRH